jgi:hypothetical protein
MTPINWFRINENGISAPDSVKIRHILLLGLEDSAIVSLSDSIINAIKTELTLKV